MLESVADAINQHSDYFCGVDVSLILTSPPWFIVFCLLTGFLFTWMMYRKKTEWNKNTVYALAALRFLSVSILSFLLLGPMVRTFSRDVEKPIIILALDESRSILTGKDKAQTKQSIRQDFEKIQEELKGDFDLRLFSFGDKVNSSLRYAFDQRQTNFSSLYEELDVQFANRNVGAMLLATDGLFNDGASPVYGPSRLKVPVHALALGDTTVRKDLFISSVSCNKVAFLGNSFPVEVVVDARQATGAKTLLTVKEDSALLFQRTLDITGNYYHQSVPLVLDAKKKGIHHYTIAVSVIDGETVLSNNSRDIFIEVVEQKQKVLVLYNAPHPDVAALQQMLESSLNYEVEAGTVREFGAGASNYNLVVLHNLPSAGEPATDLLGKLKASQTSVLFILGASVSIDKFNGLKAGVEISQANGQLNDLQAQADENFGLFSVSDALRQALREWPPLKGPFGVYQIAGNAQLLLQQKIGNVTTRQPLLCFSEQQGQKIGVLSGEGIWRWRMADFSASGSHMLSRELLLGIVQYLSVQENKSPFRFSFRNSYRENEQVTMDARLYNQSGQLVNTPEVNVKISNRQGKEYRYTMSRSDQVYTLNAGLLPIGNYSFKAEVALSGQVYASQGEFSITALQMETAVTIADHQLLHALAGETGGKVYYPGKPEGFIQAIREDPSLKSISYMHKQLEDLLQNPWIFLLIVILLSLEWFIRKYQGGY